MGHVEDHNVQELTQRVNTLISYDLQMLGKLLCNVDVTELPQAKVDELRIAHLPHYFPELGQMRSVSFVDPTKAVDLIEGIRHRKWSRGEARLLIDVLEFNVRSRAV